MAAANKKPRTLKRGDDEDEVKTGSVRPDEMAPDVIEFITAIDAYKRTHRRPFPTWSEVLDVVKGLGYVRTAETPLPVRPAARHAPRHVGRPAPRVPRRRSA